MFNELRGLEWSALSTLSPFPVPVLFLPPLLFLLSSSLLLFPLFFLPQSESPICRANCPWSHRDLPTPAEIKSLHHQAWLPILLKLANHRRLWGQPQSGRQRSSYHLHWNKAKRISWLGVLASLVSVMRYPSYKSRLAELLSLGPCVSFCDTKNICF